VGFFARNAAVTSHTADLARSIETGLQTADWNAEKLDRLHGLAADLRRLDPHHESAAPQRIEAALGSYIGREFLGRPRIDPDRVKQTRVLIELLAKGDPASAARLQEQLAGRLREWQPLVTFGPFSTLPNPPIVNEESKSSDLVVADGRLIRPEPTDVTKGNGNLAIPAVGTSDVECCSSVAMNYGSPGGIPSRNDNLLGSRRSVNFLTANVGDLVSKLGRKGNGGLRPMYRYNARFPVTMDNRSTRKQLSCDR
jgi:hypothetical protein